jgi:hypothetical protein
MRWIDSSSAVGTCQLAKIPMGPDPIGRRISIGNAATGCAAAPKFTKGYEMLIMEKLIAMRKEQKQ